MSDEVVLTFNERISERTTGGAFEQAILVSPEVPDLEVTHHSGGITLKAPEGWRPQQVYRVRVLPVVQDLFQNRMVAPFELVFGTGMGFSQGAIVGIVHDRITGRPVEGVRITARQANVGGSYLPLFISRTDSIGIYAMRWMVQGDYDLVAYTDVNRNLEADAFEPIGLGRASLGREDTTLVSLTILLPDTTPAVVGRVEVADSATLRVTLDDFVAQEDPLDAVNVVVTSDSAAAPDVIGVIHDGEYQDTLQAREEAAQAAEAAEAAEVAAAAVEADTTAEGAPPPVAAPLEETPAEEPSASEPPETLPKQEFYVLLADSLDFDVQYVVRIEGITNVNGLGGGAGSDTIVRPTPPPTDTTGVASDTTQAEPDTTQAAPDTAQAAPDTTQAAPDTNRVLRR